MILDLHHYEDPQGNISAAPAGQATRFAALWKQIGERFPFSTVKFAYHLLFDVLHGAVRLTQQVYAACGEAGFQDAAMFRVRLARNQTG